MKFYHLYGLAVASDFECPELTEITQEQALARRYETIRLIRADAPLVLPEGRQLAEWMRITDDAALYQFGDIARMLVERPDRVSVELMPGAVESDMRPFLFGTAIGTLAHMRGLVPLHISAIQTPDGVMGFTGPSGAGKSTKVAELHFKFGWPIICDDVAMLHPSDEEPLLHAGMNRIKLWKDAVERFGIDESRLTRDMMRHDKFHLYAPEMFVNEPWPLEILVKIENNQTKKISADGANIFTLLMNSVYRPEIANFFGNRRSITSTIAQASSRIRIGQAVTTRDCNFQ